MRRLLGLAFALMAVSGCAGGPSQAEQQFWRAWEQASPEERQQALETLQMWNALNPPEPREAQDRRITHPPCAGVLDKPVSEMKLRKPEPEAHRVERPPKRGWKRASPQPRAYEPGRCPGRPAGTTLLQ